MNDTFWNGDNKQYKIEDMCVGLSPKIINTNNTWEEFLIEDSKLDRNFRIYSMNEVGISESYSSIKIPYLMHRIPYPKHMVKVVENGEYILKWYVSEKIATPYSSTIIVCKEKDEQKSVCDVSN